MTLYADSSALLKRNVEEPDSDRADEWLASDPDVVTGRHSVVEVRRNRARLLAPAHATAARARFTTDLASLSIVELDEPTCELAATIAEQTGVRTLDGLHVGAARRLGGSIAFLTFDVRQSHAARTIGLHVVGV